MGASSSKTSSTQETDILDKAYNTCASVSSEVSTNLSNVQFDPPDSCVNPTFDISQASQVDSTCLIGSLQTAYADSASQLSNTTKAGLGISLSKTSNDIKTDLETTVENSCANESSTQMANISDTVIKSCNFSVVQNATLHDSCVINNTQSQISNMSAAVQADTEGSSILGLLWGNMSSTEFIVLGVIVFIIIAICIYFMFRGDSSQKMQFINGQQDRNPDSDVSSEEVVGSEYGPQNKPSNYTEPDDSTDVVDLKGGMRFVSRYARTILIILIGVISIGAVVGIYKKYKQPKQPRPQNNSYENNNMDDLFKPIII
jgi:hypothetical protein